MTNKDLERGSQCFSNDILVICLSSGPAVSAHVTFSHILARGSQNVSIYQIQNSLERLQFHKLCHTILPCRLQHFRSTTGSF